MKRLLVVPFLLLATSAPSQVVTVGPARPTFHALSAAAPGPPLPALNSGQLALYFTFDEDVASPWQAQTITDSIVGLKLKPGGGVNIVGGVIGNAVRYGNGTTPNHSGLLYPPNRWPVGPEGLAVAGFFQYTFVNTDTDFHDLAKLRCTGDHNNSLEVYYRNDTGVVVASWFISGVGTITSTITTGALDGTGWHFLAASYSHSTRKITVYFDGTTGTASAAFSTDTALYPVDNPIPNAATMSIEGGTQYGLFDVDELAIFSTALSAADLQSYRTSILAGVRPWAFR